MTFAATSTGLIVLDTNVVSELMRPAPHEQVRDWALGLLPASVRTTAVTVAEIRYGIARLAPGARRANIQTAADEVFGAFADRILPFDSATASHYGELVAERDRSGLPISGFDAQIAAICRLHRAALATRNIHNFDRLDLTLIDPWRREA